MMLPWLHRLAAGLGQARRDRAARRAEDAARLAALSIRTWTRSSPGAPRRSSRSTRKGQRSWRSRAVGHDSGAIVGRIRRRRREAFASSGRGRSRHGNRSNGRGRDSDGRFDDWQQRCEGSMQLPASRDHRAGPSGDIQRRMRRLPAPRAQLEALKPFGAITAPGLRQPLRAQDAQPRQIRSDAGPFSPGLITQRGVQASRPGRAAMDSVNRLRRGRRPSS
jgi:hypothetical protein